MPSSFRNSGPHLLSAITIITIASLVLLPSSSLSLFSFYARANDFAAFASPSSSTSQLETTVPPPPSSPPSPSPTMASQSSQSQTQERDGPLVDNFNLPAGYIIEPFLWNLSMPTSIAVDSGNGTVYVAESIQEYDNNSSSIGASSSSLISLPSEQQPPLQVRIVKADFSDDNSSIMNQTSDSSAGARINGNNNTIINNALNWPVIDMEVDDASGLLYAFDGHTTISRINITSGEREDILAAEDATANSDKYEEQGEEQQDPFSLIIHSSSQIALSGKEEDYLHSPDGNSESGNSNYDSHYPTVLYIPCINGEVDNNYDRRYCILSLPIDSSGNNAIVDNIDSINNNPSSLIVQNMTSRPVGIAILNSSHAAASSSSPPSSSSSVSSSSITEQQRPYAITRNQTSNSFGNNNYTELLVITSQPTTGSNSIVNINNNNSGGNSSNYNHYQQQALPSPSIDTLVDYPDGQLGKVVAVLVPPVITSSPPSSSNDTIERNQASSTDEDIVSSSSPHLPFGLNRTTAFVIDFGNSSASLPTSAADLPKIIMLDVQTGSITPFLTLKHQPDSGFMPIDIAFDYNNNALYVLSIDKNNNQEEPTNNISNSTINSLHTDTNSNNNNNSGVIWKISYQGEVGQAVTSNNSSISNSTDSNDNSNATDDVTVPPPPSSSSNDTASSDNSTSDTSSSYDDTSSSDDSSSSYDEEEDDTDDDSSSSSSDETSPPASDDSDSNSSSSEDTDDNSESSSSPPSSQPSTQPVNNAPIAEDDAATTDQDTPIVIDVLANDRDIDEDDSLTIDSVDEESIQGGNVRVISGGGSNDDGNGDSNNNNSRDNNNANEKIEYTPAEGFFGNDEFTYTIVDRDGATDSAKVTLTVNEIIIAPYPINYWLENEDGITQDLLEKAAEDNDNEWSFKLGNFRVPVEFDVSDSENDTKGILEGGQGRNGNNNDDDNTNAYDQLAAQLLAAKLNIKNGVSTCESIETTIEYADTILRNAQYDGPSSTENPTGESRDYAFELIEILDIYNNNGCA